VNITLDLYGPAQLRAFAVFLNVCADDYEKSGKGSDLLGGIASMPPTVWKNSAEVGDGAQTAAVDESYVTGRTGAEPHPEGIASLVAVRKRGEPSPGHKRRTKAEIAEDEAAEKADAASIVTGTDTAAISTGEARVGPEDEPEVEQQDVADETAETAKAGAELSHDDVRGAMGKYVEKFGMNAARVDLPKLFALALKDPAITKVSLIPGDQKSLKTVVDGVNEMLAKNPFSRDAVA
jgi:putative transposon-encoded protein